MNALVLLEFEKERIEGAQVVRRRVGVEVKNGGQTEAEEEIVCSAAGLVAGTRGGEAREIGLGEEERVEPVNAAFVSGWC